MWICWDLKVGVRARGVWFVAVRWVKLRSAAVHRNVTE
jgi:hypothetical protein